jgi:NAD(P)H-quinone oxidoreductase subunit 2
VWNLPGLRPLQVGLILTLVATSIAGILSNPLFTLANDSVTKTPMLQQALTKTRPIAQGVVQKTAELPRPEIHS